MIKKRSEKWRRYDHNPVFDQEETALMAKAGLKRLTDMQLSDGGWGWFSGWGEKSSPHTTAYVVHGLQVARENGLAVVPGVLERAVAWLVRYQAEEVQKLKRGAERKGEKKSAADNLDAFVYLVLSDADRVSDEMRGFLYRDRTQLSVYAKAMFALALQAQRRTPELEMLLKNIEQYLVRDAENQTAYLKLRSRTAGGTGMEAGPKPTPII